MKFVSIIMEVLSPRSHKTSLEDEVTDCDAIQCPVCLERKVYISNTCGHLLCNTCNIKFKKFRKNCHSCSKLWIGDRKIFLP